jgi:hypothetical protein
MIHEKKIGVGAMYAQKKKYTDKKTGVEYAADIKDGDVVKILTQAVEVQGTYGVGTVIQIETRNGKKAFNLNRGSTNNLVDAYGKDDAEWIGKDAKVWIFKVMKDGVMQLQAFLSHPKAEVDEDTGKFLTPENATMTVAGKEDEEEISFDEDDEEIIPDKDKPFDSNK